MGQTDLPQVGPVRLELVPPRKRPTWITASISDKDIGTLFKLRETFILNRIYKTLFSLDCLLLRLESPKG